MIIALATNAVRRHRARKFDEDVAAAAAEAAKVPTYPFDDDDPSHGPGYGSASGYSDPESHGTLAQTPMTHAGDYGMAEYPGFAPVSTFANAGAGGYGSAGMAGYGSNSAAYGPAGAGAGSGGYGGSNAAGYGAANVYSNVAGYGPSAAAGYGQGASSTYGATAAGGAAGIAGFGASQAAVRPSQNAVAPYGAFAGPGGQIPGSNDTYNDASVAARHRSGGSRAEMVEAAMAAGAYLSRGASNDAQQSLGRKQSQGPRRALSPDSDQNSSRSGSARVASSNGQESYAAHYAADFRPEAYQYVPPPPPLPNSDVNRTSYTGSDRDSVPLLPNVSNRTDVVPRTGATPAPPYSEAFDSALEGDNEDAYGEDSYMPVPRVGNSANVKNSTASDELHHSLHDDDLESIRDEEDYGRGGRTLKVGAQNSIFAFTVLMFCLRSQMNETDEVSKCDTVFIPVITLRVSFFWASVV